MIRLVSPFLLVFLHGLCQGHPTSNPENSTSQLNPNLSAERAAQETYYLEEIATKANSTTDVSHLEQIAPLKISTDNTNILRRINISQFSVTGNPGTTNSQASQSNGIRTSTSSSSETYVSERSSVPWISVANNGRTTVTTTLPPLLHMVSGKEEMEDELDNDPILEADEQGPDLHEAAEPITTPREQVTRRSGEEVEGSTEISNTFYETDDQRPSGIIDINQEPSPVLNSFRRAPHPCARKCREGEPPRKCYYKFEVEWYHTMSKACYDCPGNRSDCVREDCVPADGVKRPVVVINRQMPGPSIEVCYNDSITVDLVNHMMEETTSIHWHGHHQRGTPYMDGVPYVTQCPIPPKSAFRYRYRADTRGTHFWHSHTGCQRADGAYGALIVRVPNSEDPHTKLFDEDLLTDHIIQIIDWGHELGIEKFTAHHHGDGDNKPPTLLVNGRGRVEETGMPPAVFTVNKGVRYRFRLINSGFLNCPIEMSVDNHTLLVISSDGSDIQPVPASSLVSYAGERFDFVLEANQTISNYWMRFRGLMDCDERFKRAHQVAVLHYHGTSALKEPEGRVIYDSKKEGLQVNTLNAGPNTFNSLVMPELTALAPDDSSLLKKPYKTFYLSYDFYALDNPYFHKGLIYGINNVTSEKVRLYTPQLNHFSMKLQPFPLLSEYKYLKTSELCNQSKIEECKHKYCECTNIVNVPLGEVIELILVDKGVKYDANHPFHLHGHAFRVVAMDRLGRMTTVEEVQRLDKEGLIKRKLHGAPIKDTVTVPDGGYTILRVHASNPGYWLFHCHIEFHVELGMALVFKVGEHSDFPPVPHGFPQCNSWLPEDPDDNDLNAEVKLQDNLLLFQTAPVKTNEAAVHNFSICLLVLLLVCSVIR